MRFAAIVLAVMLVAACPPRRTRVVYVQPRVVQRVPIVVQSIAPAPVAPPVVVAPPPKEVDPALAALLAAWEAKTASVNNLRAEIALTRTDPVFKKTTNFNGVVLWMRPNYFVLRLDNTGDPTKTDYEAYICDGKALFAYSGASKTVLEFPLPAPKWLANDPLLDLLSGMNAKDVKARFDVTLFKTDEHYIYLDIKPRSDKDQREFQHLRLALYGPGHATAKFAYLPAQVYVLKPSGDTEMYKFTSPQIDLPNIESKNFQYVPVKDWALQKAPPWARE